MMVVTGLPPTGAVPLGFVPVAFDRVTTIVSSLSSTKSPCTVPVIVFCVSPAAKVSVPGGGVMST